MDPSGSLDDDVEEDVPHFMIDGGGSFLLTTMILDGIESDSSFEIEMFRVAAMIVKS